MAEIEHDEVTVSFDDRGSGDAVLLLHGHTLDRRTWDRVVPELHDHGFRTVAPDLRGHGRSSRPDRGYHWSHHVADMAAVLDALGIRRCPVVGFSLGGGVALEMAVTMPSRVASLVLLSPVLPDRRWEPDFLANLREVARTIRAAGVRAAMLGPWLQSPLFARSLEVAGVREPLEAMLADFPGADYLATSVDAPARDWTLPERLVEIAIPTLVLSPERDMPGFRAYADEIAGSLPGARLVRPSDRGHLLPLEDPKGVAEAVAEFLS